MKCVIIANGCFSLTEQIQTFFDRADKIICADGGARHLRDLNIMPDILIGDFDSIDQGDKDLFEKQGTKTIQFPSKKDQTDSELCIKWAVENGGTDLTLIGVTGTRLDHSLSNIFHLKQMADKGITGRILDEHNEIYLVTDTLEVHGRKNDFLSLVPITETVTGVTLRGLLYPLFNATLPMGSSLGVSNQFASDSAVVTINSGMLLVIKSID
jgi:thiamine pyrophosphokinase